MSYEVAIIADSVSPIGCRITTFQLKYPRMIHSELMTHRAFSRNASSSRAIPVERMIEWVEKDPAMPVYWGKNQKGMQATEELGPDMIHWANRDWLIARDNAVHVAKSLMEIGVHKQIASRILEPWAHINVVLTSTSFDNFFALRCHPAAMPEMQVLAVRMARAYRDSEPDRLGYGDWHMPYVGIDEVEDPDALKFATARCARVSYKTFEGKEPDPAADVVLHERLAQSGHWSPFEHSAQAMSGPDHAANFVGWMPYRELFLGNVRGSFDYGSLDRFGDRDFVV